MPTESGDMTKAELAVKNAEEICTLANQRFALQQENAKLRDQLAARDSEHDSLVALLEMRIEAAESKHKAASEQEPVAVVTETDDGHFREIQPFKMVPPLGTKLYAAPIPPADMQELQQRNLNLRNSLGSAYSAIEDIERELATAQHNLKGAEAMCEMQMAINRKLRAELEDAKNAN